jgi:hypothetical protein
MNYNQKYLKYKEKYLKLKNQIGGSINLGSREYETGIEYKFASGQNFKNPNNYPWLENLRFENIDQLGFSENHPGYYFEINLIENNPFDSGLANIYSLKIHETIPDFIIPDSQLNDRRFFLPNNIIEKYQIDTTNGIVTSERYNNFFRGIKIIPIEYFSGINGGWSIRLEKT